MHDRRKNSFDDFLTRIPKEHLLNQLYMFSSTFNVNEAFDRIKKVSHYFLTEDFAHGIENINEKLRLNLKPIHIRKSEWNFKVQPQDLEKLADMLNKEYLLLDMIRKN